jgi:hypothetical protein
MNLEKKQFLGKTYKRGSKSLKIVIKDLVNHPSCREFIATKLCRYLITDQAYKTNDQHQLSKHGNNQMDICLKSIKLQSKLCLNITINTKNFKILKIGGYKQLICLEPLTHTLVPEKKNG